MDALKYAPLQGPVLRRVTLSGKVIRGSDKMVAEVREEHWRMDVAPVLHEFACCEAASLLRQTGVKDPRCWRAIATKYSWSRGQATDKELAAVCKLVGSIVFQDFSRSGGWDAVRALSGRGSKPTTVASDAVKQAIDLVACAAVYAACGTSAVSAVRQVVWDVAWISAVTAKNGCWSTAWDAINARQEKKLLEMVLAAKEQEE
jgi:hypothetical protein